MMTSEFVVDRNYRIPNKDCVALLAVLLGIPIWKPIGSSQAARAIRTAALGTDCSASTGGLSTGWSSPAL